MKKLPFFLLCLLTGYASAQPAVKEMDIFDGLMYAPADMQELKKMADSLGLQFRQCKSPFSFTAWQQAPAICFQARTQKPLDALISDLKKGTGMETLKARYGDWMEGAPSAALVAYNNHGFLAGNTEGLEYVEADPAALQPGSWIYRVSSSYSNKGTFNLITAWQLQKTLQAPVIPETYGQLIAYVDCLVDTGTSLMLSRKREVERVEDLSELKVYIGKKLKEPIAEELSDEVLQNYVCAHYNEDETLRLLTENALLDDMQGFSVGDLNSIADEVISKEKLLELKRSAQVRGFCSRDSRPRRHVRDIAVLASQTHQWPVFIKAHLNIMNDYMERSSDGSYARIGRKTYLKELDQLDINTTDLLLGSTLRASNTASGHYYGDASRYGRALSEAKDPIAFESRLKQMLKDPLLDDLNKLMLFYLYINYCYNVPFRAEKVKEFQKESAAYPVLIREGIMRME